MGRVLLKVLVTAAISRGGVRLECASDHFALVLLIFLALAPFVDLLLLGLSTIEHILA